MDGTCKHVEIRRYESGSKVLALGPDISSNGDESSDRRQSFSLVTLDYQLQKWECKVSVIT